MVAHSGRSQRSREQLRCKYFAGCELRMVGILNFTKGLSITNQPCVTRLETCFVNWENFGIHRSRSTCNTKIILSNSSSNFCCVFCPQESQQQVLHLNASSRMAVQEVSFVLKRLTAPVSDDRERQRKETNKSLARLLAKSSTSNPLPAMGKMVQMVSHLLHACTLYTYHSCTPCAVYIPRALEDHLDYRTCTWLAEALHVGHTGRTFQFLTAHSASCCQGLLHLPLR